MSPSDAHSRDPVAHAGYASSIPAPRKNPPRSSAGGFRAKQFTVNNVPHLTGPVQPDSTKFCTGSPRIQPWWQGGPADIAPTVHSTGYAAPSMT
jgi:hypothetical protein